MNFTLGYQLCSLILECNIVMKIFKSRAGTDACFIILMPLDGSETSLFSSIKTNTSALRVG